MRIKGAFFVMVSLRFRCDYSVLEHKKARFFAEYDEMYGMMAY